MRATSLCCGKALTDHVAAQIWGRFQAWGLTDYTRVLYMDPRSIAVDNLDHLLDLKDPADHKVCFLSQCST